MTGDLQQAGAPAALVHLSRRPRRVTIDRLEMIADVAVREMLQLTTQASDRPAHGHRFVHVAPGPLSRATVVEPQLVIGIPVGRPHPASQMPRYPRHAETMVRRRRRE